MDKPVPVWGGADAGKVVTVEFAGQKKTAVSDNNGKWIVTLDAMKAGFTPLDLKISTSDFDTTLTNILIGEVWLCGGQSNMEYPMKRELKKYAAPVRGDDYSAMELKKGKNERIRLMQVEKVNSLPDCTSKGWVECNDSTLASFSSAGYFFGKYIQSEINVPVGLISSNWGGSRIERWTPEKAYLQSAVFSSETVEKPVKIDNSDAGLHFNSMIAPLGPYALRGFIWYQGESNAMIHDKRYVEKTKLLLDAWRDVFKAKDAPFYFVQIAPYLYTRRKDKMQHTPQTMAEFCELQTKCLELPGTGQAIVTDLVDNPSDIHPSYKWEVGRRLALIALNKTYGKKDVVFSGPVYKSMKIKGDKIFIGFNHTGGGLTSGKRNDETNEFEPLEKKELTWFSISGEDGIFYPAKAQIKGDEVIVWSAEVKKPKHVRFAWDEVAMPDFYNMNGLPAVPFRTNINF